MGNIVLLLVITLTMLIKSSQYAELYQETAQGFVETHTHTCACAHTHTKNLQTQTYTQNLMKETGNQRFINQKHLKSPIRHSAEYGSH